MDGITLVGEYNEAPKRRHSNGPATSNSYMKITQGWDADAITVGAAIGGVYATFTSDSQVNNGGISIVRSIRDALRASGITDAKTSRNWNTITTVTPVNGKPNVVLSVPQQYAPPSTLLHPRPLNFNDDNDEDASNAGVPTNDISSSVNFSDIKTVTTSETASSRPSINVPLQDNNIVDNETSQENVATISSAQILGLGTSAHDIAAKLAARRAVKPQPAVPTYKPFAFSSTLAAAANTSRPAGLSTGLASTAANSGSTSSLAAMKSLYPNGLPQNTLPYEGSKSFASTPIAAFATLQQAPKVAASSVPVPPPPKIKPQWLAKKLNILDHFPPSDLSWWFTIPLDEPPSLDTLSNCDYTAHEVLIALIASIRKTANCTWVSAGRKKGKNGSTEQDVNSQLQSFAALVPIVEMIIRFCLFGLSKSPQQDHEWRAAATKIVFGIDISQHHSKSPSTTDSKESPEQTSDEAKSVDHDNIEGGSVSATAPERVQEFSCVSIAKSLRQYLQIFVDIENESSSINSVDPLERLQSLLRPSLPRPNSQAHPDAPLRRLWMMRRIKFCTQLVESRYNAKVAHMHNPDGSQAGVKSSVPEWMNRLEYFACSPEIISSPTNYDAYKDAIEGLDSIYNDEDTSPETLKMNGFDCGLLLHAIHMKHVTAAEFMISLGADPNAKGYLIAHIGDDLRGVNHVNANELVIKLMSSVLDNAAGRNALSRISNILDEVTDSKEIHDENEIEDLSKAEVSRRRPCRSSRTK